MFKPQTKYEQILYIINSMTLLEQHYLHPNIPIYKDSPYSIYKYVYEKDNIPVGFIDVYPYNMTSKNVAFVIIGVHSKYRSQGIPSILINKAIPVIKSLKYRKIIWRCESNNIASKKTAIKLGFKLDKEFGSEYVYSKKI